MNDKELLKQLRALTSAGMKDCKEALDEAGGDMQKAVDIVKIKGLNIADGRSGIAASEGRVAIIGATDRELKAMVEVNCQTDFVANSKDFIDFTDRTALTLMFSIRDGETFQTDSVEAQRKEVVATTKENVVVRRWWVEEGQDPTVRVFSYLHSNNKIGVLITMKAPTEKAAQDSAFEDLGSDLAMQICAMNPLAVSPDRIPSDELDRQKTIFESQLRDDKKPEAMWPRIMEGKLRKWNTEVCLLEQESVVVPKTTVKQVIKNVGTRLGGEIEVINFVRCQVGEGIVTKKDDLVNEVAKLTGIPVVETKGCKI
jgi:elongation factor Ts